MTPANAGASSLQDLVGFLSELQASGVDLYLDRQGIDTTTPAGKALFQMMGVFAEFERAMIRERVQAGLARAKKHGTKSGKPVGRPKVNDKKRRAIASLMRATSRSRLPSAGSKPRPSRTSISIVLK